MNNGVDNDMTTKTKSETTMTTNNNVKLATTTTIVNRYHYNRSNYNKREMMDTNNEQLSRLLVHL